ncbi:rhodanese-like domain-containing protein [Larkinella humicola]|uniref:Rhodanese-like domain-containing protein n=1 Tax=Larkinella humicola TaxID=2607654 RepID=A0A5N1J5J2_9BACT|nr:rhodanese-like domain-containing protein [Larkinella humicola]KAA9341064.1 rhodanese-like domain-containing protein [Larkinella humicola]
MKKSLLFLFTFFLNLSAFAQESQGKLSDTHKSPETILAEIKTGKAYLVDVRTPEEYGEGHLAHSKNIDFRAANFKDQISKLDKNKPVYLYCRSGNRSGRAADTLQTLGFKSPFNIGGFVDLTTAGLPAEPKP